MHVPSFFWTLVVADARTRDLLDEGWKFYKVGTPVNTCTDSDFPDDHEDHQCVGLARQAQVFDEDGCQATCCADHGCEVYQWCPSGATICSPAQSCWTGKAHDCNPSSPGWISRGRTVAPTPAPPPGQDCQVSECLPDFDDSNWRDVDLPHDFVVENDIDSRADKSHGYFPGSKGWYRLHFEMPADLEGKSVWIDFDGVQRDSVAYLNGKRLGSHLSGYTSFRYDISDIADYGMENVLAVSVDATAPDGWWYDGGGIYRHVWLNSAEQLHIAPWGVYLPAEVTGEISANGRADAIVTIETSVVNAASQDATTTVTSVIKDPHGNTIGTASGQVTVTAGGANTVSVEVQVKDAELWSDVAPRLYTCETALGNDDTETNTFGIRKMEWDKDRGFILNGKNVKIKGFANHQDFAGVGVAVPDSLQAYRVWQHKQMGSNGWRTAHNPPTPALLDECDRQGMLVWDENHRNHVSEDMIDDLKSLILRDRNHPSVIMWSLCNEALCEQYSPDSAAQLKPIIKELDPKGQRPVSAAMNGGYDSGLQNVLDVLGVNYNIGSYDSIHSSYPNQPMIGSETSSDYSDRFIYENDESDRMYVESYDTQYPGWGNTAEDAWCAIADRDFVAGGFYWTGFDYKGEPTPYGWPNINSHFGVMDMTGFPKDNYYYHQSVFFTPEEQPILHLVPMHWNFKEGTIVRVWAYTNADSVELFLNSKSLGRKDMNTSCRHVEWEVTHYAGELTARAYRQGSDKVFASESVVTAGTPVALVLETDWPLTQELKADNSDTALITVRVVDSDGNTVKTESPDSSTKITYTLSGEGKFIGKGNGDPSNQEHDLPESPTSATHSIWNGLARLLVQSTHTPGMITITAQGTSLETGTVSLVTKALDNSITVVV